MLCMKMFVNFYVLYACIFAHCGFFLWFSISSIVKPFEFLKSLYKFPIIINKWENLTVQSIYLFIPKYHVNPAQSDCSQGKDVSLSRCYNPALLKFSLLFSIYAKYK